MLTTINQDRFISKANIPLFNDQTISDTKAKYEDNLLEILDVIVFPYQAVYDTISSPPQVSDSTTGAAISQDIFEQYRECKIEQEIDIVFKHPLEKVRYFDIELKYTGKLIPKIILDDILYDNFE